MTPQQAGELVKRLLAAYPTQRQKMTPTDLGAMTVVYTAGLIDLDFELARAAVDRAVKVAEWIPTIAKIRAEAVELTSGSARSGEEAWGDVLRQVGRVGVYGQPRFADPAIAEAVDCIGWRAICSAPEAQSAIREGFAAAYERITAGQRKQTQVAPGAGAPPDRQLGQGEPVAREPDASTDAQRLPARSAPPRLEAPAQVSNPIAQVMANIKKGGV